MAHVVPGGMRTTGVGLPDHLYDVAIGRPEMVAAGVEGIGQVLR